ncbi:MAG: DUF4421 domain-containing protein [Prevotella sp.]|nr:DUF4421 domain-containing protein [Prevotella sp.]
MNSNQRHRLLKRWLLMAVILMAPSSALTVSGQSRDKQLREKVENTLLARYFGKNNIDTAYVIRPKTKWTVKARLNVSGAELETEGREENGQHFKSEIEAERKTTVSLAVSYLGISLSASLNPKKLWGKNSDYELNINCYGKRLGFDFIYQDAKNFEGWYDQDGLPGRIYLQPDMLNVKTLNANAYYCFNSRHFSYPAAFSQSYIQRRSAGSFLLGASIQSQHAKLNWEDDNGVQQQEELKMDNIGIGAGYGYNFVPGKGWLLHISALPTFIVYSNTSMTFANNSVPLHYHFPEVIITARAAVLYQWGNMFAGISSVYNFTNIGDKESLSVYNSKWRTRAFVGIRL